MGRNGYVYHRRGIPKPPPPGAQDAGKSDTSDGDENVYEAFPDEDFARLLMVCDVDPTQTTGSRMKCCLDTFPLDQMPPYAALSYAWGRPFTDSGAEYDEGVTINIEHDEAIQHDHKISRSLYEALVEVSRSDLFRYIWVDQICIDQADQREKSSQVQRMGLIYGKAYKTIAWLGKAGSEEDDIRYMFNDFGRYLSDWQEKHGASQFPPIATKAPPWPEGADKLEFVDSKSDVAVSAGQLTELLHFFRRVRYLSRLWTIQEIVLSKRTVFLYGSSELCAVSHTILPLWLASEFQILYPLMRPDRLLLGPNSRPLHASGIHTALRVKALATYLCNDSAVDERRSVWLSRVIYGADSSEARRLAWTERLLALTVTLDCTNARDRYYGLLGMAQMIEPAVEMPSPDYELSVREVYRSLTAALLQGLPYMTAFGLLSTHHFRRIASLPSWVIDLTTQFEGIADTFGGLQGRLLLQGQKEPSDVYPLRERSHCYIEISGDILKVCGKYCDRVDLIHELSGNGTKSVNIWDEHLSTMDENLKILALAEHFSPSYVTAGGHSAIEAVAVSCSLCPAMSEPTLPIQSDFSARERPGLDDASALPSMWAAVMIIPMLHQAVVKIGIPNAVDQANIYLARFWQQMSRFRSHGALPPFIAGLDDVVTRRLYEVPPGTAPSMWTQEALKYADEVGKLMGRRATIITEGNYVGSVPSGTQAGDQIWALCRGRVPVVLRPVDNEGKKCSGAREHKRFIILGEAYIHGGMNGEILDNKKASSIRRIEIV